MPTQARIKNKLGLPRFFYSRAQTLFLRIKRQYFSKPTPNRTSRDNRSTPCAFTTQSSPFFVPTIQSSTMGCCKNNNQNDNRDYPEGVKPCCSVRGRRCLCLPYDDPWMITSQVLSIVAFFLSWIWWATMIISITGLVLYQVLWCCRQRGGPLYGYGTAAGVCFLASLGSGIYLLVVYSDKTWCEPFTFYAFEWDDGSPSDFCREEVWATIAFVCAALWAGACGCLVYFVRSGRHAKWEKKHSGDSTNNIEVVELEAVGATTAAAGPVVVDAAVVVSEPPVGNKVDDV
jgi:hypothetical protein